MTENQQKNNRIVIFGSIVQDLVSYTDRFPRPGESVRGHVFKAGSGGKGANQAVAVARLGVPVSIIALVGEDMFGDSNIKDLTANGVDTSCVGRSKTSHTATATITVNKEAENNIVVTLGANLELSPAIADAHTPLITSARMVICQGEIDKAGNRRVFEIARRHGVTTFLNQAPGDPNMDKTILELVDIICVNENEAEFITDIPQNTVGDAEKAARRMVEMGPKHAVVTLGSKGVLLATKGVDGIEHFSVEKVQAVDTTGAGDCFCGSLAALLILGHSISDSIKSAANLAALSVTRQGTQASYWQIDEIRAKFPHILP